MNLLVFCVSFLSRFGAIVAPPKHTYTEFPVWFSLWIFSHFECRFFFLPLQILCMRGKRRKWQKILFSACCLLCFSFLSYLFNVNKIHLFSIFFSFAHASILCSAVFCLVLQPQKCRCLYWDAKKNLNSFPDPTPKSQYKKWYKKWEKFEPFSSQSLSF